MTIELLLVTADAESARTLATALENDPPCGGIRCSVSGPRQLQARARKLLPDVAVVDHAGLAASVALASLRRCSPATRTLVVSQVATQKLVVDAVSEGVSGCLASLQDAPTVAKAVRAVHAGQVWFERGALYAALHSRLAFARGAPCSPDVKLTLREEQVLHLIGTGVTNKEIARALNISDNTVKTHLHRVYVKLKQSGRYKAFLTQPDAAHEEFAWATRPQNAQLPLAADAALAPYVARKIAAADASPKRA